MPDSTEPTIDLVPPAPPREFRGVWVATVANIDWPSRPGLPSAQQQAELIDLLDTAAHLKLNAVIFQVRPACDALYQSELEPWSEYLSGHMGQAPEPFYDPLALAVAEAHRRGLELHAWFNPYRVRHASAQSAIAPAHISRTHPALVKSYGQSLWLDPGEPAVQDYSLNVILDVVRRYDIDGVHIDDYFYPYKEKDAAGANMEFPDATSWGHYVAGGGHLSRDDWRRANVNTFVERLYRAIKAEKSWVKFGISPFGIWRPGHPAPIRGLDAYEELYADARHWLLNGWADYFAPQLYWKIEAPEQSYPLLLRWWIEQNTHARHIWPGSYTSRIGEESLGSWTPAEIVDQVEVARAQPGASGHIHFSMKALRRDDTGLATALAQDVYAQPALVPASPWLSNSRPAQPMLDIDQRGRQSELTWLPPEGEEVWLWVLQWQVDGVWETDVLPGWQSHISLDKGVRRARIAVCAVDRCGNMGSPAVVEIADWL